MLQWTAIGSATSLSTSLGVTTAALSDPDVSTGPITVRVVGINGVGLASWTLEGPAVIVLSSAAVAVQPGFAPTVQCDGCSYLDAGHANVTAGVYAQWNATMLPEDPGAICHRHQDLWRHLHASLISWP